VRQPVGEFAKPAPTLDAGVDNPKNQSTNFDFFSRPATTPALEE